VGRSWAKAVVDNHQLIAVEDFEPEFLSKTTMARKSADAAIGAAKRDLIERGTRAGGTVVLVPPAAAQKIANVMLVLMLMLRPCGARW
jgi:putative transposase